MLDHAEVYFVICRQVSQMGLIGSLVATAVVSSRLDYCNSLLYGMTDRNINRLQRVQNSLSRLITNSNLRCHIMPVLDELHWLPVNTRIDYKVALLTYKAMMIQRSIYLSKLLRLHRPARHLRSGSHCFLREDGTKTIFDSRAFCHSAPTVWNSLPTIFNMFPSAYKRHLKTHFYCKSFLL
jgi:hypothetical protein